MNGDSHPQDSPIPPAMTRTRQIVMREPAASPAPGPADPPATRNNSAAGIIGVGGDLGKLAAFEHPRDLLAPAGHPVTARPPGRPALSYPRQRDKR